jgi:hypothetical protein
MELCRILACGLLVKCWMAGRVTSETTLVSQLPSHGMENTALTLTATQIYWTASLTTRPTSPPPRRRKHRSLLVTASVL